MKLLYQKWLVPVDDSFQESDEYGSRVFRKADMAIYVRHHTGLSRKEGIRWVKAHANPRHVTYFEEDGSDLYRWAFKWVEEIETLHPNRYSLEAHYVIEGEVLTVVAEHEQFESWAYTVVRSVQLTQTSRRAN
jgi:hypothetical protein